MAAESGGIQKFGAGQVSPQAEVDALCRGAAVLSHEDNRIAARALLWAAVAIDPQSFVAHRRLAAALLNAEDVDAAAEEYARFIELLLKEDDVRRAAGELAYARAFLGDDMPQLRSAADHLVPLGEIANALNPAPQPQQPLQLADYAATRAPYLKGERRVERMVTEATTSRSHQDRRPWTMGEGSDIRKGDYAAAFSRATAAAKSAASEMGIREYAIVFSLATAAALLLIIVIGGLR